MKAGAGEAGGNNLGPFVEKYLVPAGLRPPQPWCAAFVSWCVHKAARKLKRNAPIPYLAGARAILNRARRLDLLTHDPQPGDLVVWSRGNPAGPMGHIGIVAGREDGAIDTIEGNKTSKVERFSYRLGSMPRLLGFVRLP